ncbi:MAG TPA: TetR/AcrR family transcriptional regulator [Solirubrobacteraceae bacterium]|jgi:AcrR family transcriptional regulator
MATPPTRPALRARYERRRQEVVDAAAKVFALRGYHATSIEDLIEATGLTRGGLYHYMPGKRDLLLAVVDELMDPLLRRAEEILALPQAPEAHLRELTQAWLEHVASHRWHMIVFSQERRTLEQEPGWSDVRDARAHFEQLLADVLERGRRDGSFSMRDPQLGLLMLLGSVNYTPQWYDPSGRLGPEEIATRYCDMLLDGIRSAR